MFQLCVFYQSPITASSDMLALTCRSLLDQHNKPDFDLAPWDDITLAAKDVLRRMFARKVKNRPIAREVLERACFSGLSSGELKFVLIVLWLDQRSLMLFLLTCSSGMRMLLRCPCQAAHSCLFYTMTNHSCPFLTMMNHSCSFSTTMNLVQQLDLDQWLICFADLADVHIMPAALPSNISGRRAVHGRSNSAKRIRAARPELAKRSASAQRTRVEHAYEGDNEPKVSWLAILLSCFAFAIRQI